ncbi:DcaP family trimeric outer membrane transporter [Allorhodopirellula heiligendammensis]|uniref:Porin subfamily protein n=1 Tax=Allorhodopirellula heiligendammensis TaxID=2714739 RepID=A0A5C6C289_9BACT|nr:DcaP family trimeric outer membrane transporter [Allorhodopirellula heiligendammensis]TWU18238.1 hypothetical protein Poly21_03930 [Allorhodopirellula heiligendammensis]
MQRVNWQSTPDLPLDLVDSGHSSSLSLESLEPVMVADPVTNSYAAEDGFVISLNSDTVSRSFRTVPYDRESLGSMSNNFVAQPDFVGGITIVNDDIAMKIGGYVKADLIQSFNPIGSTDSFVTTTIPTDGSTGEDARFHARQTRLSADTRWRINGKVARAYVEGDFFSGIPDITSTFRLRQAYGNIGRFTAGQTWTTFTNPSAVPQTLDFEGGASNVNRRQGLVRWDQPVGDGWKIAVAVEDPQVDIITPVLATGEARTETPDFIAWLRYEQDNADFQIAYLVRELGFQPDNAPLLKRTASGFNFAGAAMIFKETKIYSQILFGDGIGSYRGSPDVVATGPTTASLLPVFGWMIGAKQQWSPKWTSNVTYSALSLDDVPGQASTNLRDTTYFAVNLIANPYERVFGSIEYLYGTRTDVSGQSGQANRVQISFGFFLP